MEEFIDIINYEGLYQISKNGIIRGLDRIGIDGRQLKGVVLKPGLKTNGYYHVSLCKEGIIKSYLVHRLLALNFLPNINNLPYINHIDGNPLNNDLNNLEWVSQRENISHYFSNQNTKSIYIGVCLHKRSGLWSSSIRINNKNIHLGNHKTEIDAYNARVKYELQNQINNKYL